MYFVLIRDRKQCAKLLWSEQFQIQLPSVHVFQKPFERLNSSIGQLNHTVKWKISQVRCGAMST